MSKKKTPAVGAKGSDMFLAPSRNCRCFLLLYAKYAVKSRWLEKSKRRRGQEKYSPRLFTTTQWRLKQPANAFELTPTFLFPCNHNGTLVEHTTATTIFITRIILNLLLWAGKMHSNLFVVIVIKVTFKGILGQVDDVPTVGTFHNIFDITRICQQGGEPVFR